MATSRWKPLPDELPAGARELAERMRAALDDNGMSLRQFAAFDDVHYSVTTLQRYFSGQALPPRGLIEVIHRRCDVDLGEVYERVGTAEVVDSEPATPAPSRRGGHWRWITVAAAVVIGIGVTFGGVALFDDDVPERRPEGPDLVVNGTFDNSDEQPDNKTGLSGWWVHEAQVRTDGGLAQVAVPGGTKQAWGVMFGQSGVTVAKGKRYVLRFTAWTDKAAKIAVRVQSEKPPYTHALHQDFALNPAQKRFDHPFTAAHSTGSSGQVVFQLGGSTEDYTIYLDDVALVEQTS